MQHPWCYRGHGGCCTLGLWPGQRLAQQRSAHAFLKSLALSILMGCRKHSTATLRTHPALLSVAPKGILTASCRATREARAAADRQGERCRVSSVSQLVPPFPGCADAEDREPPLACASRGPLKAGLCCSNAHPCSGQAVTAASPAGWGCVTGVQGDAQPPASPSQLSP